MDEKGKSSVSQSLASSISRGISMASPGWRIEDVFSPGRGGSHDGRTSRNSKEDEEALRWAALEKLPTYSRVRTTIFKSYSPLGQQQKHSDNQMLLDVRALDSNARQKFIDKIFMDPEEDNDKFLKKFRDRVDKAGITLPTVEVRFQNLCIEADCHVGDRALQTLINSARNIVESFFSIVGINFSQKAKLHILKDASGVIRPSRLLVGSSSVKKEATKNQVHSLAPTFLPIAPSIIGEGRSGGDRELIDPCSHRRRHRARFSSRLPASSAVGSQKNA
ncbi:unnamed protein product [Lactuca saligna]|uniref:Pleiotropic ABC efflux transporter N-terminal domain-containing protein n=1 Tax=Lactuca saligna TaxID=75948 RepID=A0AA35YVP7_LACSI|nr:unnamed protein product [Lactuca saligna]